MKIKVMIEMDKPKTCGECRFYSSVPYTCHNERGNMARCSMGYMDKSDTRDWNMSKKLFSGCQLGK